MRISLDRFSELCVFIRQIAIPHFILTFLKHDSKDTILIKFREIHLLNKNEYIEEMNCKWYITGALNCTRIKGPKLFTELLPQDDITPIYLEEYQ